MPNTSDFTPVKLTLASTAGKVTGSITGQAVTTTTYAPETVHVTVGLATASGAVGSTSQDVSVTKPATSANEDVKISAVSDSTGRAYTISADGKSFTS